MVSTDTGEQLVEKANEYFQVVESIHGDAPPRGQWTDIRSVNLIRGKQSPLERSKQRQHTVERVAGVIENTPGGKEALLKVATCQAVQRPLPEHLANQHKTFKYEIGTKIRKMFGNKWYPGVVTKRGVEGNQNTYEIHYPEESNEESDIECITEEAMEKIVVRTRNSL